MRKIANILTNSKKTPFHDCQLYNVVGSKDDLIENIPTLIIGLKKVEEFGLEYSLLDWKINDNLYWCFSNRERRENYEDNTKKFEKLIIDKIVKEVEYHYFNVLTESNSAKREFFERISNSDCKTVYIENDIVYICFCGEDIVYGFSLSDIEYSGKSNKKILSLLYSMSYITVIKTKDFIPFELKISLSNNPYIIPWLYN